ncbi:MAG TPA: helix-turn-helix transcriptional regulator [Chitinophagaceae bacterium]|jgi:transcriptional regulator with XRE-family HTH domain|nr:helix-turn-helix transcriptional regulator [Chitinophagaceae bacterium]
MFTGEHLRIVRQIKGNQTQEAISKKLRIKQPAYNKWEKSKSITEKKLGRFLKAIPCSKDEFEKIVKLLLLPAKLN